MQFYKRFVVGMLGGLLSGILSAQYAPAAGNPGSTAIHKDSAVIKAWANYCKVYRGYIDIEDTTKEDNDTNRASFGTDSNAVGYPENNMSVVSLGDGGYAVLSFNGILYDGEGPDFAVFENGFQKDSNLYFLELAFVEVSSDSVHFVRFPSVSLTQVDTQVGGFDGLNPEKIHNLAGKYITDYGTPFDLYDLKDSSNIDINAVRFIRIVDAIGDINDEFATYDSQGHKINEPWSTPFSSGGFDLNAVAAIHIHFPENIDEQKIQKTIIYPNPVKWSEQLKVMCNDGELFIRLFTLEGVLCFAGNVNSAITIKTMVPSPGVYILQAIDGVKIITTKLIVTND